LKWERGQAEVYQRGLGQIECVGCQLRAVCAAAAVQR